MEKDKDKRLAILLENGINPDEKEWCNQQKWLITYDVSDYIKDLFDFAEISHYKLMHGMRNQTKNSNQNGKEIFISNYLFSQSFYKIKEEQRRLFA